MTGTTRTYTLPAMFYWDHVDRECASGTLLRETKRTVTVELDFEAYEDLRTDAAYYASFTGEDYAANRGIVMGAKALLRRLLADPWPVAAG